MGHPVSLVGMTGIRKVNFPTLSQKARRGWGTRELIIRNSILQNLILQNLIV